MENPFEIIIERLDNIERTLFLLSNAPKVYKQENEFMSLNRVIEYTDLSKYLIYKFTSTRKIPHYKRGGKLYFKKTEIDNWITENKIKTSEEILLEMEDAFLAKHRRK